MDVLEYAMMVEDTHVKTQIIEYRRHQLGPLTASTSTNGILVAVALTDVMTDGLSMVYSFYDPDDNASLGTFMILDHINRARALKVPYVYLGYWVQGSRKMQYKIRFKPQEHLGLRGWERRD